MAPLGMLRVAVRQPSSRLALGQPVVSSALRTVRWFATDGHGKNQRTGEQMKVTNIGATGKTEADSARKYKGTTFPELLEHWSRERFKHVGVALTAGSGLATLGALGTGTHVEQAALLDLFVAFWWYQGYKDMNQTSKAIPHNFPVIGNFRYLLESIRPEIRQYFIESDDEATPYDRAHRAMAYQRAKNATDTLPLGTRRDVYKEGYEWIGHSMFPKHMKPEDMRCMIGGPDCKQPYSASLLNVSAMSYGALSQNAILALNGGAKLGTILSIKTSDNFSLNSEKFFPLNSVIDFSKF